MYKLGLNFVGGIEPSLKCHFFVNKSNSVFEGRMSTTLRFKMKSTSKDPTSRRKKKVFGEAIARDLLL